MKIFLMTVAAVFFSGQAVLANDVPAKESVVDVVTLSPTGKTVKPVFSEKFSVIGIGLMKGQLLEKHDTPTAAFLLVQEGEIEFRIKGQKVNMRSGDFFRIPPKEMHEIQAIKDSRLLLAK